ncbi:MAG: NAD(P)-dependent oxidoreductase [Eggerthellaceae bacterium]|nr:NAD(P)-dependent oxidoreductase [Eggerthellaceae bacterium]
MSKTFVFVGLTNVGNEMAPNLLEAGFKAADGVSSADVVFTYVPFIEDTEEVYFGSDGMIATAKEGALLVNLAPISPSLQHEIYALAQVNNMTALDAPVVVHDISRTHAFADRGNLTLFVGANDADYDVIADMLEALSADVVVCGSVGMGQLAKAATSLHRAAEVVGLIEADALCRASQGDDDAAAAAVVGRALAVGPSSTEAALLFGALSAKQFDGSYSANVLLGEVVAALSTADDANLILPQAESAEYLLQLLMTIGGGDKAAAALSLLYADEESCARNGLDWSRAEGLYGSMDGFDYDDYDDYDDYGDYDDHGDSGHGHGHGHGHGGGFGFGPYSTN